MNDPVAVQIVTTVAEKSDGVQLARELLERRLAACVQIDGPLESLYRWEGTIQQESEWRLTIKTTHAATQAAIAALHRSHPYDEPEILVVPVSGGSDGYLRWLNDEVRSEESRSEESRSEESRSEEVRSEEVRSEESRSEESRSEESRSEESRSEESRSEESR